MQEERKANQQPVELLQSPKNRAKIFKAFLAQRKNAVGSIQKDDKGITEILSNRQAFEKDGPVNRDYLSHAIQQLHILQDGRNGIQSQFVKVEVEGVEHHVLYRDAKLQDTKKKYDPGYENWAIMGLNYLNAARKLLSVCYNISPDKYESQIQTIATKFFDQIKTSKDPQTEMTVMVQEILIPFLVETLKPAIEAHLKKNGQEVSEKVKKEMFDQLRNRLQKELVEVRDFCNFDQPAYSLATLTQIDHGGKSKEILQVDVPMCGGFTDKQKKEFQLLANPSTKSDALETIDWFQAENDRVKKLIRHHAKDILEGRMTSTQLRKFIPGIRNAGEVRLFDVTDPVNDRQIIQIHHSGTLAHLLPTKAASFAATVEGMQQAKNLMGAKYTYTHSLLSPSNPFQSSKDSDHFLVSQMQQAAPESKIEFANSALNPLRYVESRIENHSIVNAASRLIREHSSKSQSDDKEQNEAPVPPEKMALIEKLKTVMRKYHNIYRGKSPLHSENTNLRLAALRNIMADLINQIMGESNLVERAKVDDDFAKVWAVIVLCRSGKDRAGLVEFKTVNDAILLDTTEKLAGCGLEKHIVQRMAHAGHIRKRAGLNGGTLGACGIKADTYSSIPTSYRDPSLFNRMLIFFGLKDCSQSSLPMIEKTAKLNEKIPKLKVKPTPWYKNKKFGLGCLAIGGGIAAIILTGGIAAIAGGACAIGAGLFSIYKSKVRKSHKLYNKKKEIIRSYDGLVLTQNASVQQQPEDKRPAHNTSVPTHESSNGKPGLQKRVVTKPDAVVLGGEKQMDSPEYLDAQTDITNLNYPVPGYIQGSAATVQKELFGDNAEAYLSAAVAESGGESLSISPFTNEEQQGAFDSEVKHPHHGRSGSAGDAGADDDCSAHVGGDRTSRKAPAV